MSDFTELVWLMKTSAADAIEAAKPAILLFGTVQSTSPIRIFVDQKTILEEHELILAEQVTDYHTTISFDNPGIKQVFTTWDMEENEESGRKKIAFKERIKHEITVYQALKPDDKVILLRMQGGQRFIVLDRIGGGAI